MHRCYVPDVRGNPVEVTGDAAHHMAVVLRLAEGAPLSVFDGRGREWRARVAHVAKARVVIDLGEELVPAREPGVVLTLAVGLLKGDQMSQVVRDATALGITRIEPFVSRHTAMARPSAWADLAQRWHRVAVASAAQCGRAVVPEIASITAFDELLRGSAAPRILCVEPALASVAAPPGVRPERATLFVGPEGGWAREELDAADALGAHFVSLGPRTLRAELAPVVALTALWTTWGWS